MTTIPASTSDQRKSENVAQTAFKVMLGSFLSLLTSLLSVLVVAWVFGAGAEMDAFTTAWVVPAYLQAVLLSGLAFVLIPAFVREKAEGREEEAWALAGTFFWITGGVLTLLAVWFAFNAPTVVALTAPGLSSAKAQLTSKMLFVLMFSIPIAGLGNLASGVQNARGSFFWPTMGPILCSFANIAVILLGRAVLGPMTLAWAGLASALIMGLVPLVPFLRHGWKRLLPLTDPRVKELGRLVAPFIVFGVITRATPVFERYYASGLPDGALSSLGYAAKIGAVVMSVFGVSIATAIFPVMARKYEARGKDGLAETALYGVRLTLAIALPMVTILSATSVPLVQVFFERGAFTHETTLTVAQIVPLVLIVVLFDMLSNVTSRTFYVMRDTVSGPRIATIASILYVILAGWLVAQGFGIWGLALAGVVQWSILTVIQAIVLARREVWTLAPLLKSGATYFALALLAGFVAYLFRNLLGLFPVLVCLGISILISGILYLVTLLVFDRQVAINVLELVGAQKLKGFSLTAIRNIFHLVETKNPL